MHLTHTERIRQQKRAIPELLIALQLQFGKQEVVDAL
jgi:hypothetical protein